MRSFTRIRGIMVKELLQLKRERLTFGMIVVMPVVMLMIFGYAINSDPKHLPTIVLDYSKSDYSRSLIAGLEQSGYFEVISGLESEKNANLALQQGRAQFVLNIPADFAAKILRNEYPQILLEADATDPSATAPALAAVNGVMRQAFERDFPQFNAVAPYGVIVHHRYNPEQIT